MDNFEKWLLTQYSENRESLRQLLTLDVLDASTMQSTLSRIETYHKAIKRYREFKANNEQT